MEHQLQAEHEVASQAKPEELGFLAVGETLREEIETLRRALEEAPRNLPEGEYVVSSMNSPNRRLSPYMQAFQNRVRGKIYRAAGIPYGGGGGAAKYSFSYYRNISQADLQTGESDSV